jgi:hypothetical protein
MDDQKPTPLSDAEIEELKAKRISFMKDQMEALHVEVEYTKARADIAENQYREMVVKRKYAELIQPAPKQEGNPLDTLKSEESSDESKKL